MKLTRKAIRDIVIDAIEDVTDGVTFEEEDDIAEIVANRLADEAPELVEDEIDLDEEVDDE